MIRLTRIEAVNIRSLGDAVFDPLTDGGITALNGLNGAGKTSILHALVWALYGDTPDGVPVRAMRRQGSEGECRATVTFEHDGQTVCVTRELRGAKDTTTARITVDGVEQSNVSARTARTWVINRLNLEPEGFLTAFVIRQKELDGLVRARPADRRRLIERLAGIDRMSQAVKVAREEEAEATRALSALPGSAEELTEAEQGVTAAARQVDEAEQAFGTAEQAEQAALKGLAAAQRHEDDLDEAERTWQAAATAASAAERAVLDAERVEGEANRHLRDAETFLADHADAPTVAAAVEQLRTAEEALSAAQRSNANRAAAADQVSHAQRTSDTAQRALQQADQDVQSLTGRLGELREQVAATNGDDLDTLVAEAVINQNTARDRHADLRAEHGRIKRAIAALSEAGGSCCPTCDSQIADPQRLLDDLNAQLNLVVTQGQEAAAASAVADDTLASLRVQHSEHLAATQQVTELGQQLTAAQSRYAAAEIAAQEATENLNSINDKASGQPEDTTSLETAVSTCRETKHLAERVEKFRAELDATRTVATEAAQATREATDEAQRLTEHAAALALTPGAINAARDAARDAARTATDATGARTAAEGALQIATSQHQQALDLVARIQSQLQAQEQARGALEVKVSTRNALDDFRKDRIARIAPELSEVATDFVNRMTNGDYTAVTLDEEFTPIITDATGRERPVSWLSGGEESAVALALRVAIGELIAGHRGGLLWLDEVLTAQDPQRRAAMMAAIRELPHRQVITINHVSEATDMVDAVFTVTPSDEGSVVTQVDATPDVGALGALHEPESATSESALA
jgi:DNA repair protein SbcC/Rad50